MRFRLYPTIKHKVLLVEHCAHARYIWNLALEQANYYRPHWGPTPNYAEQSRQLTEARKYSAWLTSGSSMVQVEMVSRRRGIQLPETFIVDNETIWKT
jgi:hypothetical protein